MTDITARQNADRPPRGPTTRFARLRRRLSDRVHQGGDALAHEGGWDITTSTGRFGFAGRVYRDPRFAERVTSACGRRQPGTGRPR